MLYSQQAGSVSLLLLHVKILTGDQLPEAKKNILVNVLSKLKQKVIWKWDSEQMEGKPDNVLLKSWLPQQDILGIY